ncbi:MAG: hypothetical protein J3R72DRAFT_439963 [Linnemannia gamsii]|nr:MAG: hypothetical protein J3R72DRAFT_439963 [Linnemannia gamsii]
MTKECIPVHPSFVSCLLLGTRFALFVSVVVLVCGHPCLPTSAEREKEKKDLMNPTPAYQQSIRESPGPFI